MKIKEWLKKREQAKYDKREEEFRQAYLKIPKGFIDIHSDTPTAFVALSTYKTMTDLKCELKCMDNRYKHLAHLVGHLQEGVTRLSEEVERKADKIQMD